MDFARRRQLFNRCLPDTADHRETADAMLSNNVVLRYMNNREWFDVHPSVRQIPGVKAEIAKLAKRSQPEEPAS